MVFLKSIMAFDVSLDPQTFARDCRNWGFDAAVLHPGFFSGGSYKKALKNNNIKTWLNIPVFHNREYLDNHPGAWSITSAGKRAEKQWLAMVCPSHDEYIDYLEDYTEKQLAAAEPDIVSLDFVRFFVFWEMVDTGGSPDNIEEGCYCPVCLSSFEKYTGEKIRVKQGSRIPPEFRSLWGDWKCGIIIERVKRLADIIRSRLPGVPLHIKTVPWKENELDSAVRNICGQNLPVLDQLSDGLIPMAFTGILGKTLDWKRDQLMTLRSYSGKPSFCYIQTARAYDEEEITPSRFEAEVADAVSTGYENIIVFHYEQLEKDEIKSDIIRKYLKDKD